MPALPLSILLLAENEKAAALDRRALRDAGYQNIRVESSGIEAARLIAGMSHQVPIPDIIISQAQLSDMDGEQFCAIVRQHPSLLGFPVLLILPNDEEAQQLRALGCGASALMGRPYSVEDLQNQIAKLAVNVSGQRKLRQAAQLADTRAFDEALATYGVLLKSERQPEDFFKAGMKCLDEARWTTAIAAFERAVRDAQIKAEAELGIAAAYKGKGDLPRFKAWLARASESFVQAKKWNRARRAYARLLQYDPSARNPFLGEAHRLIRQSLYDEAADVLNQGLAVLSKRKAGDRLARVCMAAEDPEKMFAALMETFQKGRGNHAEYLGKEIRESLSAMEKQKRERLQRQTVERKWELAKSMGALPFQKRQEEERTSSENSHTPFAKSKRKLLEREKPELREQPAVEAFSNHELDAENYEDVLEPFAPQGKKQGFNELLSVIKLTWRLARKADKKA